MAYGIPYEDCDNSVDDDQDGDIDCADDDCSEAFGLCVQALYTMPFESYCDDEVDNDLDGRVDCADPDCIEFGYCAGYPGQGDPLREQNCTDQVDEDDDGDTDCADSDCAGHPVCMGDVYGIPF